MTTPPTSFEDRDGQIWMNGTLVPWRNAKLHVFSHVLHYGSAVFEGERAYGGKVFKLEEHTDRLFKSAEIMEMNIPFTPAQLNAATNETLRANNITDGYVRPIAWRGSEQMGVGAPLTKINVAIGCWVWPQYYSLEKRLQGIRMNVSVWRRPPPNTAPVHAKAAGLYMISTLSKHAADRAGYDDAIMYDWRGQIAEASGANIFFVFNGEVHTPIPDCFLDGITRRTVMDLARKRGMKVVERVIMPEEMAKAQECFLCGTAAEVTPVREIGEYKFTPGDVCRTLMGDYDKAVGKVEAKSSAA